MTGLLSALKSTDEDYFIKKVDEMIVRYGLSQSSAHGYAYYSCESSGGLGAYNKIPFTNLRKDFNSRKRKDITYYAMFYVLMVYSFNNQIRFNRLGEFNLPVGKRDFNAKMREKLARFMDVIKRQDCVFLNRDFRKMDFLSLKPGDFLYADPPYLITCAAYNEKNGWTKKMESSCGSAAAIVERRRGLYGECRDYANQQRGIM